MFVLRAEIVTIFEPKMATISARNTNIYKIYNISQPNFAILLIFIMSFLAVVFDSLLFTQIKI
jgi:hypothetical protein